MLQGCIFIYAALCGFWSRHAATSDTTSTDYLLLLHFSRLTTYPASAQPSSESAYKAICGITVGCIPYYIELGIEPLANLPITTADVLKQGCSESGDQADLPARGLQTSWCPTKLALLQAVKSAICPGPRMLMRLSALMGTVKIRSSCGSILP